MNYPNGPIESIVIDASKLIIIINMCTNFLLVLLVEVIKVDKLDKEKDQV